MLIEEIGKLKFVTNAHAKYRYRDEDGQKCAEQERKDMVGKLVQVLADRSFLEEHLLVEHERSDDLSTELRIL